MSQSPAFRLYLAALALLPFRWLSPLGSFQDHADWTDILVALATAWWLVERLRERNLARASRAWQLPLVVYVVLACLSAAAAVPGRGGSWTDVVVIAELAMISVLTADFGTEPGRRRLIARTIVASSLGTVALAVVGLILFYAHVRSGLIGGYGQLTPSHLYARVQAGFESPQLLSSFCIFASGIVASEDAGLSRRLRVAAQVALLLLCAATISRAVIGFLVALVLRRAPHLRGRARTLVPIAAVIAGIALMATLSVVLVHVNASQPWKLSLTTPVHGTRRESFVTSLHTLEHHPLLGIGPGGLPGTHPYGELVRAHFTPLNVAATLGLPALVALVTMLCLLWRGRRRPTNLALWSALAAMGVDGLGQDIDHFRHVWVLLGLLSGGADDDR